VRPLAFTFPYVVVLLGVFVWTFVREDRLVRRAVKASTSGDAPADRGSIYAVIVLQGLGFFAAFLAGWIAPPWARFANQREAFWIGLAILIAGAVLRRICFRALGESFTGEVRVRPGQHVVTNGPYRWVRHPSYSAGILLAIGIGVTLGTWLGAVAAGALTLIGYAYRVSVEERALLHGLGDSYRDYMMHTKRFIPFVI
jgi:protein-S-isoprenylcysteine O-methyltransferase Ste14